MSEVMEGGCQCARIRYAVRIDDDEAYLCHCRMCQRAAGTVSLALKSVARTDVTWTGREPDRFRSSPFAQRGFCAACGTSLTYEANDDETMDLTIGSFDDPTRFRPTAHFGVERCHAAWLDTTDLPMQKTDQNARIVARWKETHGHLPD